MEVRVGRLARVGVSAVAIGAVSMLSVALVGRGAQDWTTGGPNGVLAAFGPLTMIVVGWWWWHRAATAVVPLLMIARGFVAALSTLGAVLGTPSPGAGWATGSATWAVVSSVSYFVALPLTCGIALGWPAGRMTRAHRALVASIGVSSVMTGWGQLVLLDVVGGGPNPLQIAQLPALAAALGSLYWLLVLPLAVFAVTVAVVRAEQSRNHRAARHRRPAVVGYLVGGALFEMANLIIYTYLREWMVHDPNRFQHPTALGWLGSTVDPQRLGLVVMGAGVALGYRRLHRATSAHLAAGELVIDVSGLTDRQRLSTVLARDLDDPKVAVRFLTPAGEWVDQRGLPVGSLAPDRVLTPIASSDGIVAAIDTSFAVAESPSLVEAGAAAAALLIDHERLEALAAARQRALDRTRVALVEAHDGAMARLERDLHDGAQQQLVSLALAAGVLRRAGRDAAPGGHEIERLRARVTEARQDLLRVAHGLVPSLLVERGLDEALAALARSSPLPVAVHGAVPDSLPIATRTVVWFVVCESVANTIKHAEATSMRLELTSGPCWVAVEATDDGTGGADPDRGTGLRRLRDRLCEVGGRLDIESAAPHGTTVRALVPVDGSP